MKPNKYENLDLACQCTAGDFKTQCPRLDSTNLKKKLNKSLEYDVLYM